MGWFYLSNTANLWSKDLSWKAVLIEGDEQRFADLVKNTKAYNCVPIHAWVGINEESKLEAILKKHTITDVIDLLSIDIDGNDYFIFDSLLVIRPRLVICEYNPTIPVTIDITAEYATDNMFGTSVASLNRIAEAKGYKLVALTVTNAFYVRIEDFDKFADFETDLRILNVNDGYITLITTQDGRYTLVNNKKHVYFYGLKSEFTGNCFGAFNPYDVLLKK